jgi:DNA-binding transcriptional ArsR family regulator
MSLWVTRDRVGPAAGLAIGIEPRTVQRHIARLEAAKLIRREERRFSSKNSQTNIYHLEGLIEAAKPYALEKVQEREAKAAEKAARAARKGKPKLALVKE